jgi:diguanylate cyclase (GGDEF)-like protein
MTRFLSRWSAAVLLEAMVWAVALMAAIGLPSLVFVLDLQYQRGAMANMANSRAYLVSQRIAANPNLWRFEELRLLDLVQRDVLPGDESDWRAILDMNRTVIVENRQRAAILAPVFEVNVPLHDAGQPVGAISIQRSMRPLIYRALWQAAAAIAVFGSIVVFLRRMPLRALRRAEAELEHKAFHDDLTGLHNRDAFRQLLGAAVSQAARERNHLAVLFVDLDRFKSINDTLGHDAGDEVLRAVADRLRGCVRASDVVARLSGDEFAIAIGGLASELETQQLAEAVLARFEAPFGVGGRQWHLSCSVGLSVFPAHSSDPDKLLAFADTAMLQAKSHGRSSCVVYSEHMQERVASRVGLETDLHGALERNEFVLHYQPLVDMRSGVVKGSEALLRWQHPTRGLVPPGEFIPVLEDLGLIHAVGQWVMSQACQQMMLWLQQGASMQSVAVNVSALQFSRPAIFLDAVRLALAESGLPPKCLQLELTEGLLMSDSERSVMLLDELKAIGVSLAIDDFGTGYSSLAYLRRFPVTTLKVDRSFVRHMCDDSKDASIVKAVIQLAHNLGLLVTAEGIEEERQLSALRALGCDVGQGFLLGRPQVAAALGSAAGLQASTMP